MKRLLENFFFCLLILAPVQSFAKVETAKITIAGADLRNPIDITDPKILSHFRVWDGLGTSSVEANSFIIDWSKGPAAEPPSRFKRYQVSFFAKLPRPQLVYVVFYEYDPSTNQGYVYFPGKTDEWYQLNASTILRGDEGNWYHSSKAWDETAWHLIYETAADRSHSKQPRS